MLPSRSCTVDPGCHAPPVLWSILCLGRLVLSSAACKPAVNRARLRCRNHRTAAAAGFRTTVEKHLSTAPAGNTATDFSHRSAPLPHSSTDPHRHAHRPRSAGRCRRCRAVASPLAATRRPCSPPPAGPAAPSHSTGPRTPRCCRVFGSAHLSQRPRLTRVDAVVAAVKRQGAARAAPRRLRCCRAIRSGLLSQRLQLIRVDAVVAAEEGRGAVRAAVAGGDAEDSTATSVV